MLALVVCVALGSIPRAGAAPETQGAALDATIQKGVRYLLETQNRDGSWGSPASNLHDIYAPVPGSQQAFQVASSGLALSALLEVGGRGKRATEAIEHGTAWMLKHHGVRRVSPNTLYNIWAHAYALEAFARLLARTQDRAQRKRLHTAAALDVKRLATFEFVEGGWGYYNFGVRGKDPGPGSTAFTTSTVLAALRMAAKQGVTVPGRLPRRGLRVLRLSRKPDNSYIYSLRFRFAPQVNVNQIKGSLARTPAALVATLAWSEDAAERKRLVPKYTVKALTDLETYGHFLRIARKYPIPHEAWYQNSGYFCFYGYYYASILLADVPLAQRARFARQIAGHLVGLQESDGSFWDYQLFKFHKVYGTGYVLMTLGRCRDAMRRAAK